jgi:hypothetical protein
MDRECKECEFYIGAKKSHCLNYADIRITCTFWITPEEFKKIQEGK